VRSSDDVVRFRRDGAVAVMTLNRPNTRYTVDAGPGAARTVAIGAFGGQAEETAAVARSGEWR
jgi:hypothetical protein